MPYRYTVPPMSVSRMLVGLLCVGILVGCDPSNVGRGATNSTDIVGVTTYPVKDRAPAPALVGTTLTGQSWSLASQDRGDIVFINVWASWCGPCRSELPMLAAAAKRLRSQGVRFLGVDERDHASHARAFIASTGATYPNLFDPNGSLLRELTLLPQAGVPSTLVLDPRGRMAARVIGAITSKELAAIVSGLRKEALG
jgi:thiol-disulfide isomerase/thioredoxin